MKSIFKSAPLMLALAGTGAHAAQVKFNCSAAYSGNHATVLTLIGDLDARTGTVKTEYMTHPSSFAPIGIELVWAFHDGNTTFQFNRDTNGITKEYQFVDGGPESVKPSSLYQCDKA